MGNRAVIVTDRNLDGIGIYLHWHGGRDSVEAFLAYCKLKGYRSPENDCYGWAYLTGVITNFFGDGYSCGVDIAKNLDCDNWDNSVYVVKKWLIVDRIYKKGNQEQDEYELREFIKEIDERQPAKMRLTKAEWDKFNDVEREVMQARNHKENKV